MTIIKVCTKCNIYKPLDDFAKVASGFFSRDGHGHVCIECNPKRLYDKDAKGKLIPYEEWPEERMDVIGQNGNTGEHYEGCTTKGLDK